MELNSLNTLIGISKHLTSKRRKQLFFLIFLMIAASLAEILSIGAIFPFLTALANPDLIFNHQLSKPFIEFLGLKNAEDIIYPLTFFFIIATVLAGLMRLFLLWYNTKISYSIGTDLGTDIYEKTLYQPYSIHISRNSSQVIDGVFNKTTRTMVAINLSLNILSNIIMFAFILGVIFYIDFLTAIFILSGFGIIYFLLIKYFRNQVLIDSERIALETTRIIKILQEGLNGAKDVLLTNSQKVFTDVFQKADYPYRMAQARNIFAGSSPRFLVEALAMSIIACSALLIFKRTNDISSSIPILGSIALAGQRLLPIIQQMYSSWTGVKAEEQTLKDTLSFLDQKLPEFYKNAQTQSIDFKNSIKLSNISFKYPSNKNLIIKKLNLEIKKGEIIGFIGKTGSGKSTLFDLFMGILDPLEGSLLVDGRIINENNIKSWFNSISHVQQDIFLTDNSILENIAFGVPRNLIDIEKVKRCAKLAEINQFIDSLPNSYQSLIGERGVKLSGGQRQRLGIARALYKDAKVIFFDEATSSLDEVTEKTVMESLYGLGKNLTICIIAHRTSTLNQCDRIIELEKGKVKN